MKKTFVISDLHLNHKNILKYESTHRPFCDLVEMHKEIINRWNETVSNEDTVLFLGDFGFGDKKQISSFVKQLNGDIVLVRGNHDNHGKQFYLDCGFIEVHKKIIVNGIIFSHYPLESSDLEEYINIHGHIHSKRLEVQSSRKHLNVSAEVLNFFPMDITNLIN